MSWPVVKLADCARIVSGATPKTSEPKYWDGEISWVTPKDISDLGGYPFLDSTPRTLTAEGLASCSAERLPPHSVLLSSRAPIGLVAINRIPVATNQGFKSFVPDGTRLDAGFLYHWLRANRAFLENLGTGATFKEISKAVMTRIEIPLPPLDEQKRIAAVLDKADTLRRQRQESLQLTEKLFQSVFIDMFGDPVSNPKGFPECKIGDLLVSANYGTSEKSSADGTWPVLRMGNITYEGGWDFTSLKYMELDPNEERKYLVRSGEILFNRTNSKELVGKTAVYREARPMAFAGYLIRCIVNEEADPEYISAFLNSTHGKTILRSMCKAIVGMANINAKELQTITILKPPVVLQNKFGEAVRSILRLRASVTEAATIDNSLLNSIQQRAFRGELDLIRLTLEEEGETPAVTPAPESIVAEGRYKRPGSFIAPPDVAP